MGIGERGLASAEGVQTYTSRQIGVLAPGCNAAALLFCACSFATTADERAPKRLATSAASAHAIGVRLQDPNSIGLISDTDI